MIEINLNNEVIIYKSNLNLEPKFDKQTFIEKLITVDSLVKTTNQKNGADAPGRQSSLSKIYIPELIFIKDNICKLLSKTFKISNDFIIYDWLYYSDNDNTYTGYHTHDLLGPKKSNINHIDNLKTDYTFTYYVQMPNNLKDNQGKLFFKTKLGYESSILPEEGDIFIFPGDLQHKPEINPNSTKARIVVAGNVASFDNHIAKNKKTFL
jgi:hypothetical protein